jgi:hypothetical protein
MRYLTIKRLLDTASGHNHDGVNSRELATVSALKKVLIIPVEDLAANGDISARVSFKCPTGQAITITKASIISQGSPAGIDDSNTCVIAIFNGSDTVVTKTYNTSTAFPSSGTVESLGTISDTYKTVAADGLIKFSVTNGTTANTPLFAIQIEYTVASA